MAVFINSLLDSKVIISFIEMITFSMLVVLFNETRECKIVLQNDSLWSTVRASYWEFLPLLFAWRQEKLPKAGSSSILTTRRFLGETMNWNRSTSGYVAVRCTDAWRNRITVTQWYTRNTISSIKIFAFQRVTLTSLKTSDCPHVPSESWRWNAFLHHFCDVFIRNCIRKPVVFVFVFPCFK